jgi:putative membrane protein
VENFIDMVFCAKNTPRKGSNTGFILYNKFYWKKEDKVMEKPKENSNAFDFVKYDRKGFFHAMLLGVALGLFAIIPGVSSPALMMVFGLYDKIVYANAHILKDFKRCFLFLLPTYFGNAIGFLGGLFGLQALLKVLPFSTILLFAGLMIGSFPIVLRNIKGYKKGAGDRLLMFLGILVPVIICFLTLFITRSEIFSHPVVTPEATTYEKADQAFGTTYPLSLYFWIFPVGMVIGLTQVIPGLSGSAFCMMIGIYAGILDTVHIGYWILHPLILVVYVMLGLGYTLGFFLTNVLVDRCFNKHRQLTNEAIVGLSLGSILMMFCSREVFIDAYMKWYFQIQDTGALTRGEIVDAALGIPFLALGIIISLLLVKLGDRKDKQKTS